MSTDITMSLEIKDKDWKYVKDKEFKDAWKALGYSGYGCLSDVRNYNDLPYFKAKQSAVEFTEETNEELGHWCYDNMCHNATVQEFLDWFEKQDKEILVTGYVEKEFQQMVEQGEIPPTYCLWSDTEGSKQMSWKEPHPLTRLYNSLQKYRNKEARIIWIFW